MVRLSLVKSSQVIFIVQSGPILGRIIKFALCYANLPIPWVYHSFGKLLLTTFITDKATDKISFFSIPGDESVCVNSGGGMF